MGDIRSSEGNSDSKLLSNPNRGYYGKSYPGQRFFVQEPGPFGEKSTRGGTLMGWSFITTHGGKVTGYTSSYLFHKDGKQPNFAIEDGEMAVYNGKRKGKESENPSSWRRLSDSRLLESVAQMRKKTLKADGWTMIAPHEWAIEEMPRKMSVAPESPSEGSASKESTSESSGSKTSSPRASESKGDRKPQYQSAPIVSSSSKESLLQRSADEDTELFESLFSKKRRKEHAEKFFMSLLAKGQPWLGARSSLAHPIVFDPNVPWEMLPYKAFTHTTPQCAALGHFLSRSETDKPTNPLMKSPNFTIIIRDIGRFDHTGRQPGLMIQATNFSIRQLDRGFVPGERRVEIWRNGETFCLPGVIAVMADRCAWFLGDEELRRGEWIMEMEKRKNLVSGVGLGQP